MYSIIFKMLRKNFRNGRMQIKHFGMNCIMRCCKNTQTSGFDFCEKSAEKVDVGTVPSSNFFR